MSAECVPACEHGGFCSDPAENMCICSSSWGGPGCSVRSLLTVPPITVIIGFIVIVVASQTLGKHAPKYLRLPLITGYLLVGVLAGSSVLDLIPEDHIRELALIDSVSLSFISFTARTKMVLRDYKNALRPVVYMSASVMAVELIVVLSIVMLLAGQVAWMADMSLAEKFAVCLFLATLLTARSPATILAVIEELKVSGPFTRLAVGVTVVTDMLVIIIFALDRLVADQVFSTNEDAGAVFGFAIGRIVISILLGLVMGVGIPFALFEWVELVSITTFTRMRVVKAAQILILFTIGFALFIGDQIEEAMVDPLLSSMIAGFYVANYSRHAVAVVDLIHDVAGYVFVAFFTITGAALKLESLGKSMGLATGLCVVRAGGMFLGSYVGGRLSKSSDFINKFSWMAYMTQAGVSFGLAKKIHLAYPSFGGDLATLIVSVVILNQLLGPPMCKWVLKKSGEAAANILCGNCLVITDAQVTDDEDAATKDLKVLSIVLKKANWQNSVVDVDALRDEDDPENLTTRLSCALRGEQVLASAGGRVHGAMTRGTRAASLRMATEGIDTFKGAKAGVDVVVLMLAEDDVIRKIVYCILVHFPKVRIVVRLLAASKLHTVKNLHVSNYFTRPNQLPDSVCVLYDEIAKAQTLTEMVLEPAWALGPVSIFARTALGAFGSPVALKLGDAKMAFSGDNVQLTKRMSQTMMPERKLNDASGGGVDESDVQLHMMGDNDNSKGDTDDEDGGF